MSEIDEENVGEILQDHSTSVKWKIPAFFSLPQDKDFCIKSPSFTFLGEDFYLRIYPNWKNSPFCPEFIRLYVVRNRSSTCIEYILGIQKTNGELYQTWRVVDQWKGLAYWSNFFISVQRLDLLSNKIEIAPDDTLTIFCVLQAKKMDCTEASTQTTLLEGWDSFSQNMRNLLKEKCLCDITIKLKDEELRAHKIILAAHSSVFSAMFAHEMSEKNTGIVEIFDFESNVFKEFLQYLYTGSRDALSPKNICELYGLAHKYDVKHLQKECVSTMIDDLTVDTFCDVISLAVKYGESELTKEATNFFLKNVKSILVLSKWQVFMHENTTVANELFIKTVENLI